MTTFAKRRPGACPALAAGLLALAASAHAGPDTAFGRPDAGPSNQACEARANDSVDKLLECIREKPLWQHMVDFQQIADDHPGADGHGNRDTGTAGYKASVDHVARRMRQAGYRVQVQKYRYTTQEIDGLPRLGSGGREFALGRDWFVARLSAGGSFSAPVEPVGGSGSGCAASEFAGFAAGRVALLRRGDCHHDLQVAHAREAGARAVVLYNNPGDGKGGAIEARLTRPQAIPVIGTVSGALAADLLRRHAAGEAPVLDLDLRMRPKAGVDYNLIAESPWGDPQTTVVVDAHLDSIYGAGMLDNASGSVTVMEIALKLAKTPTRNRLRYVWFGGEEIGLLGSDFYTRQLSAAERKRIAFDIDVDVTATPNFDYLVADPAFAHNVDRFPKNVVPDSQVGNQLFADYFASVGVASQPAWFGNDGTDSNSFSLIGVPNTGILTQQNCCKKDWEVALWGGSTGNYEGKLPGRDGGCVDRPRRWCDNLDNNDPAVLELASKATAYVVFNLANRDFPPRRP